MLINATRDLSKNTIFMAKNNNPNSQLTPSQTLLLTILEIEHCSLQRLARQIGISLKTIKNLISGQTKDPHIKTFNKIFLAYCQSSVKYS